MKKFLLKTLLVLFLFTGVGIFNTRYGIVTVQASIVEQLGNPTVYYTPNGKSFHLSRGCSRLSNSKVVYNGQLNDVISGKSDPCDLCVRSSSNNNSSQNNSTGLNVNKEELRSYLENAYKKAFFRDMDEGGHNYWKGRFQ